MMAALSNYHDWRPSHGQELLLQAALRQGQRARQAWQEWSSSLDFWGLDYGSRRLLPLLYHNLRAEGIDHPLIAQFRKVYLDTWARNQVLFAKISPLLQSFHEAGIGTMVLKGASLIVRYYRDFGLRPMSDFDFLVPTQQVFEAIALLRRGKWEPQRKSSDRLLAAYVSTNNALHFSSPTKYDVDLHWHLLSECLGPDADQDFWEGADRMEINGVQTRCLNPADSLFHICIHGVHWNNMPPVRWVADAVMILKNSAEIDWNRTAAQAEKRHLTLPLGDAFCYLVDQFDAPIPSDFLKDLSGFPVSRWELKEYKTWAHRPYAYVPSLWAYYPRIAEDTGRRPGLMGFVKYLQDFWGLEHIWQVPLSLGLRILKKFPALAHAGWMSMKRFFGLPPD
jgi:hypothetical protein